MALSQMTHLSTWSRFGSMAAVSFPSWLEPHSCDSLRAPGVRDLMVGILDACMRSSRLERGLTKCAGWEFPIDRGRRVSRVVSTQLLPFATDDVDFCMSLGLVNMHVISWLCLSMMPTCVWSLGFVFR